MSIKNSKSVLVAMSGGVDSSVAAVLLKEQGYSVIGITMKLYDEEDNGEILPGKPCCTAAMAARARSVCDNLGVPHYVVDFREVFNRQVKDNFYEQYINGMTPNPCVRCNTLIKWQSLVKKKVVLGADFIATGHYARSVKNEDNNAFELHRGIDRSKDQTYFLWGLTGEQLNFTFFPLGELTKNKVRKIADQYNLVTAHVSESQEICFIPGDNYRRYIDKRLRGDGIKLAKGEFRDVSGNLLGSHSGYHNFTIGQRKSLGIALGKPVYVTKIDANENVVVLGDVEDLLSESLHAESVSWINGIPDGNNLDVTVKIRYRDPGTNAALEPEGSGDVNVFFKKPIRAVTPGQSVVFYKKDRVLGGGIISKKAN